MESAGSTTAADNRTIYKATIIDIGRKKPRVLKIEALEDRAPACEVLEVPLSHFDAIKDAVAMARRNAQREPRFPSPAGLKNDPGEF